MSASRSLPLLIGVWSSGVALATGIGVLAVDLVRDEVGDPPVQTVTARDVGRAFGGIRGTPTVGTGTQPTAAPPPVTAGPTAGAGPGSPPTGVATTAVPRLPVAPPAPRTRPSVGPSHGQLAPPPATTGSPSSPAVGPAAPGPVTSFASVGGSLGVRCLATTPERVYATPSQGYRLGPQSVSGTVLQVDFSNAEMDVEVSVDCASGTAVQRPAATPDNESAARAPVRVGTLPGTHRGGGADDPSMVGTAVPPSPSPSEGGDGAG